MPGVFAHAVLSMDRVAIETYHCGNAGKIFLCSIYFFSFAERNRDRTELLRRAIVLIHYDWPGNS